MKQSIRMRVRNSTVARLAISVLSVALAVAGCKDITSLKQQDPSQLSGKTVFVPANAQLIVNGVVADFECAFGRYALGTGLFTDELANAIARTEDFQYDTRNLPTNSVYGTNDCVQVQIPGIYTPLSVARASADTAVAALEGWTDEQVPHRSKLIGTASAYGGYSIVLLGESMCSAAINLGPELTPAQLFALAITRFDTAVEAATRASDATTLSFALLGRARAKLDAGDLTGAAADAQLVPVGFIVQTSSDAVNTRRQNAIWSSTTSFFSSVDTSFQATYDATVAAGTPDPRIAYTSSGQVATNGFTVVAYPDKDATSTAPITIAKWSEAQLIIAENDVANSNLPAAILIINDLHVRAGYASVYAPSSPTAAAVLARIVEERKRELFLEGHRMGDLRRYNLPFLPLTGSPYGSGGTYGTETCFPLPDVERINNPNI